MIKISTRAKDSNYPSQQPPTVDLGGAMVLTRPESRNVIDLRHYWGGAGYWIDQKGYWHFGPTWHP